MKNYSHFYRKLFSQSCILAILVCACTNSSRTEINNATIGYEYSNRGHIVVLLEKGKYLLFDTGSEKSIIFNDRISVTSTPEGTVRVNKQYSLPVGKVVSFQIGDLRIKNHSFVFNNSKNTVFQNDTAIAGIIGLDILSQKYCYFDIQNRTITFSDKKETQSVSPAFVLNYKSSNRLASNINIDHKTILKDVLFDTGYNLFLELLENDRVKMNRHTSLQQDTNYDIFNNRRITYFEYVDSILINNTCFQNCTISYGQKSRFLGMEFAKHWSSFSIDPFNRKIEFYL